MRQVAAKEEGSVLAVRDRRLSREMACPAMPRLAARVPQIGPKEERRVPQPAATGWGPGCARSPRKRREAYWRYATPARSRLDWLPGCRRSARKRSAAC